MRSFEPFTFVSIALVLAVSCSSAAEPPGEVVTAADRDGDVAAFQRGLIACYEDNGIDAVARPDGSVRSDTSGTLSREESMRLSEVCHERLVEAGIVDDSAPTADELRSSYDDLTTLRDCLIEHGHEIPEFVSEEVFVADPSRLTHPLETVFRTSGHEAAQDAEQVCGY